MSKKKDTTSDGTIALNKKARHDYHIEEKFEAGLSLEGWECKAIRAGRVAHQPFRLAAPAWRRPERHAHPLDGLR